MSKANITIAIYSKKIAYHGECANQLHHINLCKKQAKEKYPQTALTYKEYNDIFLPGVSKRRGSIKLIDDIKNKRIDAIYTYTVSELINTTSELASFLQLISAYNIAFVSLVEHIDSSSTDYESFRQAVMKLADIEKRSKMIQQIIMSYPQTQNLK